MIPIAGIQQIGIGVSNVQEAFKWYRQHFGMDIPVFEEAAEANLMLPYTGGMPHKRHAILAINMKGGGGFEIWQYTSRKPQSASFSIQFGDLGIYAVKIKSANVQASYEYLKSKNVTLLTSLVKSPNGTLHFFLQDPFGNIFEIIEGKEWFGNGKQLTGGVAGCIIGVSNIEKSKQFYANVLGYDKIIYESESLCQDLAGLSGAQGNIKRALLTHKGKRNGAFSKLLGDTFIELVQVVDRIPKKMFENRYWGDLGYIHLCFDVTDMAAIKKNCELNNSPFTVDSANSFDMGEAAGHFSYIEDPDGTWIEFVETHKVPVFKKIGWYLNLKNRNPEKPLPNWMVKALAFGRVRG